MTKFTTDRYAITVGDMADIPPEAFNNDKQKMAEAAIDLCRERARLYIIPCVWEATWKDESKIIVTRKRKA